MSLPKFSIVMPLFNHEKYVRLAISSVVSQSFVDWELIIIDDGSTDASLAVVRSCLQEMSDSRLKLITQKNCGAHVTINRGIAEARADYILILNSDDLYHSDRLRSIVVYIESSAELPLFLVSRLDFIDSDGQMLSNEMLNGNISSYHHQLNELLLSNSVFYEDLLWGNVTITTSNFVIHKDLIRRIGGFRNFRFVHDWDFALRALRVSKNAIKIFSNSPLVSYRLHGANTIRKNPLRNHLEALFVLRQTHHYLIDAGLPIPRRALLRTQYLERFLRRSLRARVGELETEIKVLQRSLAEAVQREQLQLAELVREQSRFAEIKAELVRAQASLSEVFSTRSWRYTALMRWTLSQVRRVSNALMNRRSALQNTGESIDFNKWRAKEALFILSLASSYRPFSVSEQEQTLISVLLPVHNISIEIFSRTIESLRKQIYKNFEVCICDDGSDNDELIAFLQNIDISGVNVRVQRRDLGGGIAVATNEAFKMARGKLVVLLDHDDELAPHALLKIAEYESKFPNGDVFYSDEDQLDLNGNRLNPFFKPDWSPFLLVSQNYIGHLVAIRSDRIHSTKIMREGLDGAQDHDLLLRLSIEGCVFVHIPQILYHWRRHMGSTSINPDSKPEAHEKGRRSVDDHLRAKYGEVFSHVESSTYQFVYSPRFKALSGKVSIIIPTKDRLDLLVPCIQSIVSLSTYQNLEVIVINNRSMELETRVYLESLLCEGPMFKTFDFDFPFNWSAINNFGAKQASGEYFIFLNNDTRVVSEDWIERLGEFAQLADVGPVGPLLLYPDGTIQHAGVVVGMKGWADHVYKGESAIHRASPYVSPLVTRDVLAVTGACMMISRHKFQSIGTFDEQFQICGSDVEFCIRSHTLGHHNLYIPTVKIEHLESKTRSSFVPDVDFKQSAMKYGSFRTKGDPFFNKNLSRDNLSPQPLWPDQD